MRRQIGSRVLLLAALVLPLLGCATAGPPRVTAAVTVRTPGATLRVLPVGYRVVRVRGVVYYHRHGVYYRPHRHGYIVVASPWR